MEFRQRPVTPQGLERELQAPEEEINAMSNYKAVRRSIKFKRMVHSVGCCCNLIILISESIMREQKILLYFDIDIDCDRISSSYV